MHLTTIPTTMSSREIAELVEARHNDVVSTIDRLFNKGLLRSSRITRMEATGGRPVEVYDLTERDTHLVVAGYSDEHRARVIDRWSALEAQGATPTNAEVAAVQLVTANLQAALLLAETACRVLRLDSAAALGMMHTATKLTAPHLLPMLPVYGCDAPTLGATLAAHAEAALSLTELLKRAQVSTRAAQVNKLLLAAGLVEHMTRPSTSAPGMVRTFWSVTEAGRAYGKNATHPTRQHETQPLWYVSKFPALRALINI